MVDKKLSQFDVVDMQNVNYLAVIDSSTTNKKLAATDVYSRTNCFTYIPQDIQMTLSSYTVTLKANSKVYYPNGVNAFNTLTIPSDLTYTSTGTDQIFLCIQTNNSALVRCFMSGASVTERPASPVNNAVYYNTTNNVCEYYNGSSWVQVSFPIAIVTRTASGVSEINQVFNGFGWVGSTIFMLPGVKGLIPNGRNANGSLKNTIFTVSAVKTETRTDYGTATRMVKVSASAISGFVKANYSYDFSRNYNYEKTTLRSMVCTGDLVTNNNKIVSFTMPSVYTGTDLYNLFSLREDLADTTADLNQKIENLKDVKVRELFEPMWSDHIISDSSWIRTDTFSWLSGNTYSNAYNHLTADINGKSASTETISGTTITFYKATDGHKIILANQEANATAIYNNTQIAWYYILDTTNKRFKLPRSKWNFLGYRNNVGNYVEEALPNIKGTADAEGYNAATGCAYYAHKTGAFYSYAISGASARWAGYKASNNDDAFSLGFDASKYSSIYKDGAGVNQRSTQMYLYMYVGQFTQTALEQTAGLNSSLFNGKADVDLNNTTFGTAFKQAITKLSVPKYNAAVTLSWGSAAPADGWICASGVNGTIDVKINGRKVAQGNWATSTWSGNWNLQIMVNAGDVITYSGSGYNINNQKPIFMPFQY